MRTEEEIRKEIKRHTISKKNAQKHNNPESYDIERAVLADSVAISVLKWVLE